MKALILITAGAVFAQTAALMPQPKHQFLDNSGNPLSGGKLYTYQAGTTTPLATYTDTTQGVANANPVILDSGGRANVWLSNRAYKIVLKSAADVTIWTIDNVQDWGQILKRDLADTASDSLNSALVGFKPPSGTPTTVRAKLIELSNAYGLLATSYGAVGNGTANDTAAIQACIDAAASIKGICYLPPGTYGINSPLVMRTSMHLRGAFRDATKIKSLGSWSKNTADALIVNDNTKSWQSMISNLTLEGNATTGPDHNIRYYGGNFLILEDLWCANARLEGIFLDQDATPSVLNQSAYLNRVTVVDSVRNSSLSGKHGALTVDWTDVYVHHSGFFTDPSTSLTYTEGGKRVGCYFRDNSANAHMDSSECSHSETGIVIEGQNSRFTNSRAQFNSGHGVEVIGFMMNFAAFQSQFNGESAGTFYSFYVKGSGNTFDGTSAINSCPSAGCVAYAFRFEITQAGLPNIVSGHSGTGSLGMYTATDEDSVYFDQLDRQSRRRDGYGGLLATGPNAKPTAPSYKAAMRDAGSHQYLSIGSHKIAITAATSANPMEITLASARPENWIVGSIIGISGARRATFIENTLDPCSYMNQFLQVTAVGATTLTLSYNNTGCVGYVASSGYAFLAPTSALTVDRPGDATNGAVAGLALHGRVSQVTMEDKRALPFGTDNSKFKIYTNYDEAAQTFSQWIFSGSNDAENSESRYITLNRDPAGLNALYAALMPTTGYVVVGDAAGDSATGRGVLQFYGGTLQSGGLAFGSLGTPSNGRVVWCTDCNIATPCTSGGAGAWAFRSGGQWKCPF